VIEIAKTWRNALLKITAKVGEVNHDVVRPSHDTAKIIVEVFRRWVLPQSVD
jgi:hypothetical protein